jgi:feruloyl esterase
MPDISTMPDLSRVLWPLTTLNSRPEPPREPKRRAIDVGAVITRALTAAGLMK